MQPSFFFYDYETTGIDPKRDRIIQFAGIRTDENFEIIAEPIAEYCKLSPEIVPHPEALLVTGISKSILDSEGLDEVAFTRLICREFSTPNTSVAGYNNIRFDDEFTRYSFYRNFYDPYAREWQNSNSRWDLIDVVRMCAALRPDGICWPRNPEGKISFKLEELTKANGLVHEQAHDALSDVYATIEMAKLIRQAQPKLLSYLLNCRKKAFVDGLINLDFTNGNFETDFEKNIKNKLLVHSSRMISSEFCATSVFLPLYRDKVNKNNVVAWDLRYDPNLLLNLSNIDEIKYLLFTPESDLKAGESRLGLKNIFLNKVPALAPFNTVDQAAFDRMKLDSTDIVTRAELLIKNHNKWHGLIEQFTSEETSFETVDVEHELYNKFIPNNDKYLCNRVHTAPDNKLIEMQEKFSDSRLRELMFRYRARNYPNCLSKQELAKWHDYCSLRLNNEHELAGISKQEFVEKATLLVNQDKNREILSSWLEYYQQIDILADESAS